MSKFPFRSDFRHNKYNKYKIKNTFRILKNRINKFFENKMSLKIKLKIRKNFECLKS